MRYDVEIGENFGDCHISATVSGFLKTLLGCRVFMDNIGLFPLSLSSHYARMNDVVTSTNLF